MTFYKVNYSKTDNGVKGMYQYSYKDHLVDEWLKDNCKYPYYHSGGWETEKFIEFEDSKDAVLFALRWAK